MSLVELLWLLILIPLVVLLWTFCGFVIYCIVTGGAL